MALPKSQGAEDRNQPLLLGWLKVLAHGAVDATTTVETTVKIRKKTGNDSQFAMENQHFEVWIGKSSIDGPCLIAMSNYLPMGFQWVYGIWYTESYMECFHDSSSSIVIHSDHSSFRIGRWHYPSGFWPLIEWRHSWARRLTHAANKSFFQSWLNHILPGSNKESGLRVHSTQARKK